MGAGFNDLIALEDQGNGVFLSKCFPESNGGPLAFGGLILAMGVNAAYLTVKTGYQLYSATGYFLSPSKTDRAVKIKVVPLRDTKTFATRRLELSQRQDNGQDRLVLHMVADFQVAEPASLLTYSAPPAMNYSSPEHSWTVEQLKKHAAEKSKGGIHPTLEKFYDSSFGLTKRLFEARAVPEGIAAQTLVGLMPQLPTTQDHLEMTSKTTTNYYKSKDRLGTSAASLAAMAYVLDAGSAAVPVAFGRYSRLQVEAVASLDFAMRFFTSSIDLSEWNLREDKTIRAGEGRSYQNARVWDLKGNLVADMTQQCILRPGKAARL